MEESSPNYTLFGKFTPSARRPESLLSPNREDFILEMPPNTPLGLVARKKDNTMVVLDLKSGIP